MKPFSRIMIAVDFSEPSAASVRYSAQLAANLGSDLLMVNVIDHKHVYCMEQIADRARDFSMERYLQEMIQDREALFRELVRNGGCNGLAVKTRIRVGIPYQELLREIDDKSPDLLVMADKGRGALMDTISGSCAQKLFRLSPVPVLVFREPPGNGRRQSARG